MIAILAVILCHVDSFYPYVTTSLKLAIPYFLTELGRIGVPLFLMISGALLLNREYPSLEKFLKKRFARIIYPFIFWIILILGQLYYHGYNSKFIWNVFIGEPSITWYFWILIGIYLFIPVLNSFIKDYNIKGAEYFLAVWLFTMILKTFNAYPLWHYFNLDMFASFIGYPVLGYWLANKDFKLDDKKLCILGLIMLIISLAVFVYLGYTKVSLIRYENLPNMMMGVGLFLFIMCLDRLNKFKSIKDNFIGKAILSLSVCSYGMYFSHTIVVKELSYHNPGSNILFPLMFVLIVFLSWLLPYMLSKIPYVKTFSGV
jgi:surface polysaccharide O-acyltransferase-like enzyme